jgi:hypothetical protein
VTLEWERKPVSRELTRNMRAINRVKQMTIDDHRLFYEGIAEVWATIPGEDHVVLTHKKDPAWQYWYKHPEDNWIFLSVHTTREGAQEAVQASTDPETPPGRYVIAQLSKGARKIRVLCTSESGPDVLSSIFTKMDYTVKVEDVA